MAIHDLDSLREELPDIFEGWRGPTEWEDDYIFLPIDKPDSRNPSNDERYFAEPLDEVQPPRFDPEISTNAPAPFSPDEIARSSFRDNEIPTFGSDMVVPGAPIPYDWRKYCPPPDALGFHIPFHYGHPIWWGVYLVVDGVMDLANFIHRFAVGKVTLEESIAVARMFIFGHEVFHHIVETFSMRLEVTHRVPLYKRGFHRFFRERNGTDDAIEEALASAHGYRRVKELAFRNPNEPKKRACSLNALEYVIRQSPPGYNNAMDFVSDEDFLQKRAEFAELNHREALPHIPGSNSTVWNSFPHGFSGINNVNGRANYLIKRSSPLGTRLAARGHHLRYRELSKGIRKLTECDETGVIKGSHVMWKCPGGQKIPVPRHPREIGKGLTSAIIKQFGLKMTLAEFQRAVKR